MEIKSTLSNILLVKAVVYGDAGVGKTVLLSTAPRPLILSVEGGLLSLAHKDIAVIEISLKDSVAQIKQALKFLQQNNDYDTIGLDSLSELAEARLAELKLTEKDPRQAYMKMADELYLLVRMFRALNKHTVLITKQVYETDESTGKTMFRPFTPGKAFTTQIPYLVDEVFCMRMGTSKDGPIRFLQTQPDIQYSAKDRSGKLSPKEEPNLTAIFNKILTR